MSFIRDLLLHSGDNFLLLHHLGLPLLQHLLPRHQEGANAGRDDGEPTHVDESDVGSSDTSGHPDPGTILKGEDETELGLSCLLCFERLSRLTADITTPLS